MAEKLTNLQKLAKKIEALVMKPAGLGGWEQRGSGDWALEKTIAGKKMTFIIGYTEREDDLRLMYEMSPWVRHYHMRVYGDGGESVELYGGEKLYGILCEKKQKAEKDAESRRRRQEERQREKEANKYDREQNRAAKKLLKGFK